MQSDPCFFRVNLRLMFLDSFQMARVVNAENAHESV
jgi:hypothetical protein